MRLSKLYEQDETAWLEQTARLVKERKYKEIDRKNLAEYLSDMARRDRREVLSRLTSLLVHLIKWDYQPSKRSRSWKSTILAQQDELRFDLGSQTLRSHAEKTLAKAYARAVVRAAAETGLREDKFPLTCPYTIDELLQE